MFEPTPLLPLKACDVSDPGTHAPLAGPAPWQNRLLAALPPADYERLLPHLEPVALPPGWAIHGVGERERYVYFITAGLVSRFHVLHDGQSVEFAMAGREGVIGVAPFLGAGATSSGAIVLAAGHAYRLKVELLETGGCSALQRLLLHYTQALMAQAAQAAVCNRHHALEQQLCRWILGCLDRLPSNELVMTHKLIAHVLGVRRASVSQVAARLQRSGILRCARGRLVVLDRPGLEARVCECYAVVRRAFDLMLPAGQPAHWRGLCSRPYRHERPDRLPSS